MGIVASSPEHQFHPKETPDEKTSSGQHQSELFALVTKGNVPELIKALATLKRYEINGIKDKPYKYTLLHHAVISNQIEVVTILLNNGMNINSPCRCKWTPLHLAMHRGLKEMGEFLISKGADTSLRDSNGQTPLFMAIWSEFPHCAELLLSSPNNVAVDVKDHDGDTPLSYALSNDYKSCYKLLLEFGACDSNPYIDNEAAAHGGGITIERKAMEKWGTDFTTSLTKEAKIKWELRRLQWVEQVLQCLVASASNTNSNSTSRLNDDAAILALADQYILNFPVVFETDVLGFLFPL
jgi:hypothetical protein